MSYSLWIVNQFANTPELPGHTRQYDFARHLHDKGVDVEIFTSSFNLSLRDYIRRNVAFAPFRESLNGVKLSWLYVTPYKYNNLLRTVNLVSFCITLFLTLFTRLITSSRRTYPDYLYASSPQLPAAAVVLCISKIFRIRYILEVRDLWPQALIELSRKPPHSLMILFLSHLETWTYRNAEFVCVLASGITDHVLAKGAKQVLHLPNGPDANEFPFTVRPKNNLFTFMYSGAHGEANGLDILIEAAAILDKSHPHLKIVLQGDGPLKNSLRRSATGLNNITFLPPVPKHQMPQILSKVDASIVCLRDLPLFSYGVSPNKLYDSYAMGCPVVTNIPGQVSLEVNHHHLGETAIPGDPISLANAMVRLSNTNRDQLIAISGRARSLFESKYSRSAIVNQLHYKLLESRSLNH